MYWENYGEQKVLLDRDEKRIAKKEHKCCECGRVIKKGEKYSYFFGVWRHYGGSNNASSYKTCLECEKDWDEILKVFHENEEDDACRVFGLLREAIQDAFDADLFKKGDRLPKKWLGIEPEIPEVDIENLSPEERKDYEKREAVLEMRVHSVPLL